MAKYLLMGLLGLVLVVAAGGYVFKDSLTAQFFAPRQPVSPQATSTATLQTNDQGQPTVETVATGLTVPWEVVFLPDYSLLVTERPGTLLRIKPDTQERIRINGVAHTSEGGLMGAAMHPEYEENHWIYIYLTTRSGSGLSNRVERYTFDEESNQLSDRQVILENIPGSQNHDGGRIAFGPDGYLYITTGDAGNEDAAQDTQSLAGKILRVTDEGDIPSDNPFGNEVYSYGHRNPQGLAWDSQNRLWSTEHGRSGVRSGYDEVNLIEKGGNYGWPIIEGDDEQDGMRKPVLHSGADDTWAPAGLTIINDTLYWPGLRGQALYAATITGNQLGELQTLFAEEYGRLRIAKLSPDGWLYLATSNRDGRGQVNQGDDRIVRIKIQ